ncbi:MAG: aminoacyl-tRNA hydrolase [Phycisphaerae bacterium]|nr:aminoacyl-tRNA hydrolase [Phycisphaerae bacterium]
MDQANKFIVGLGNPGRQYQRTRHNVGYMVLAELAKRWSLSPVRRAFDGETCEARLGETKVILLAPQTYMNLSGQSVQAMLAFYKAEPADVLVVLDDMALPTARLRFRADGSSGGQKGLADILRRLGTPAVPRLRIGIGSPPPPVAGSDYVLGTFGPTEMERMAPALVLAAQAVEDWVRHGMAFAMEKYNRSSSGDESRE